MAINIHETFETVRSTVMEENMNIGQTLSKYHELYKTTNNKRKADLWVFGSWFGNRFADNPKMFFLYVKDKPGIHAVWVTKSKSVMDEVHNAGGDVYIYNSAEAIKLQEQAKYIFICTGMDDVYWPACGGATIINFWHGVPLKKVVYDDKLNKYMFSFKTRLYTLLQRRPFKNQYVVATSQTFATLYESAFKKDSSKILNWGQPRNDIFFNGVLKNKKYSSIQYCKLIAYLPTHRNEGATSMADDTIFDLDILEDFCKKNSVLFIIKKHYYHQSETMDLSMYPHILDLTNRNDIDTQELLFNANVLITDYSSCYIDYLLLKRPIIFYCFDYDKYMKEDRQMYFDYNSVTPGDHAKNFNELLVSINNAISGNDRFKHQREKVTDMFYDKKNQHLVSPNIYKNIVEGRIK